MAYSWVAVQARTGRIITDLPGLSVPTVGATLGDYWAGEGTLPVDGAPADWVQATAPMSTYLVLLDDAQEHPIWGGWITQRQRTHEPTVTLGVASWEHYLSRRFMGSWSYVNDDQCAMVLDIMGDFVLAYSAPEMVPPMLLLESAGSTIARERTYEAASNKTILDVLQELSGVENGPEWTVTWRHLSDPERYVPVMSIADRIGNAVPAGLGPAATFEMPGPVASFQLVEDWTGSAAANNVIATSTADGETLPMSAAQVVEDPDRPTLEYRFTPSTSITNIATLTSHAARALALKKDGSVAIALSAVRESAPRLGLDWGIGDDIGYRIQAPSVGVLSGVARAIGWVATTEGVETVTPILASEEAL